MRVFLCGLLAGCSSEPVPETEAPSSPAGTEPATTTHSPDTLDETGALDTGIPTTEPGPVQTTPPDYARPGPYTVTESSGTHSPSGPCVTPYTLFVPDGAPAAPHVVLAHGFSRYEGAVSDLARHFASWGLSVATHTMCHATPFDNDPDQDAADLQLLSDLLGGGPVLYAGHSAGGLRSVLAGVADPDTVAVLGLDLVDVFDLALDASPALTVPLYGLVGESDSCNADANGEPVYAAAATSVVARVTDADHCDFEAPTDILCTLVCEGDNPSFTDGEIREVIRGMATGFLLWQAGLDGEGARYWTAGEDPWDSLAASGRIRPL